MIYVVIDTNVLVSALLSKHPDSSTVVIRDHLLEGDIIPLFNREIISEYITVLTRPKFQLPTDKINDIIEVILQNGILLERTKSAHDFIDISDAVFYEVALSKEGALLVTGNTKHFPKTPIVVTPIELLRIIEAGQKP